MDMRADSKYSKHAVDLDESLSSAAEIDVELI